MLSRSSIFQRSQPGATLLTDVGSNSAAAVLGDSKNAPSGKHRGKCKELEQNKFETQIALILAKELATQKRRPTVVCRNCSKNSRPNNSEQKKLRLIYANALSVVANFVAKKISDVGKINAASDFSRSQIS